MVTVLHFVSVLLAVTVVYVIKSLFFKKANVPSNLKQIPLNKGPSFIEKFTKKQPLYGFLNQLGKKHPNGIFSIQLGLREIVILNNYDIMHKSLKEKGNVFSGRWQNIIVKHVIHDSGILFKDKELWATQRSFLLRVLRDFGFGKQRSQEIIEYECSNLIAEIEEKNEQVISCRTLFPIYMVNIIAKLAMSVKFTRTEPEFLKLTSTIESVAQQDNIFITMLLMIPFLEKMPFLSKALLVYSGRYHKIDSVHMFIKGVIDEHRLKFNPHNEGEDVIDMYLLEQHKLQEAGVDVHTFTEWQIIRTIVELFIAGYETTSTTLSWAMLYLARNQKIQEKVFQEIKTNVGSSRFVNLNDKKDLPYTQAVMDEVFRLSSVVPLALPHRVLDDTELNGYFFPRDSVVFPNLYAIHRDETCWEKPYEFHPEHFLSKNPDGSWKYETKKELNPFGIGKRQCLGESLARMEFFMFFVNVIQKFEVRLPDKTSDEIFDKMTFGTDGTIRAPLGTDVIFKQRN